MKQHNNLKKKSYIQSGGLPGTVAKIGEYLIIIVMYILTGIYNLSQKLFNFEVGLTNKFPFIFSSEPGEALFFKFFWLAVKSGLCLVVFAFGGPIITLVAVGFMYQQLFKKFNKLKKMEKEGNEDEDDEEDETYQL